MCSLSLKTTFPIAIFLVVLLQIVSKLYYSLPYCQAQHSNFSQSRLDQVPSLE